MRSRVVLKTDGDDLIVVTPHSEALIAELRVLGGQWDPERRAWICDTRDEARVRQLCLQYFSTDGNTVGEVCDLRLRVSYIDGPELRVDDRVLLGRSPKTGQAWTPQGVAVVSGVVPTGTGTIGELEPPVVIEVRDIPPAVADSIRATVADMLGVELVA